VEQLRADVNYPRSTGEFRAWFRAGADCLDHLEWLRWPAQLNTDFRFRRFGVRSPRPSPSSSVMSSTEGSPRWLDPASGNVVPAKPGGLWEGDRAQCSVARYRLNILTSVIMGRILE
jgi:hypothetical protein